MNNVILSAIFYLPSSILHPPSSILYPQLSSIVSVRAPQQSDKFVGLPCVQVESVCFLRRLVAAGAFDARVAPFVGVFVLNFHLFQRFCEVALQTLITQFGGQVLGRGGAHGFSLVPGRQPPQSSYDKDDDCDKDQVAGLHFHQMITGFDLDSIYYQRNTDGQCNKRL
jgi:hypothetical protein